MRKYLRTVKLGNNRNSTCSPRGYCVRIRDFESAPFGSISKLNFFQPKYLRGC